MRRLVLTFTALATGAAIGCGGPEPGREIPTFEEFEAAAHRDPESGVYVVDGDTPVLDREELRVFYDRMVAEALAPPGIAVTESPLIVHRANGVDAAWDANQRNNLTYCVSNTFGTRYAAVVQAMNDAAAAWEESAAVNFIHVPAQDASCTASNANVVFDVRPVSGQSYLARAFFPNYPRASRNILIDSSSFSTTPPLTLTGILRHELGHAIGFRHEHTRPESGACFEDNNWRPLTPYDSASVMHYPQCNGTNSWALLLSARDREGAAILYPRVVVTHNLTDSGVTPLANNDSWTYNAMAQSFTPPYRMRIHWVEVCAYDGYGPSSATLRDGSRIDSPIIQTISSVADTAENCGWIGNTSYRWRRASFTTNGVLEAGRQYTISVYKDGAVMGLTFNDSQINNGFNTNIPYAGGMMWDTYGGARSFPTWDMNMRLGISAAP